MRTLHLDDEARDVNLGQREQVSALGVVGELLACLAVGLDRPGGPSEGN
jgi:hypothetical protein